MFSVETFFDEVTNSFTYVLSDPDTSEAVVIDPVLLYDNNRSQISAGVLEKVIDYITTNKLVINWILETHIHADHLTGSFFLRKMLGGKVAISNQIYKVVTSWAPKFGWNVDSKFLDGGFDIFLKDGDELSFGKHKIKVLSTSGHTPASSSYLIDDAIFVGDVLMMPDLGTARADFIGGSASDLYHSVQKIFSLPKNCRVFVGHDYPLGRDVACFATVEEHLRSNAMIRKETLENDFVNLRNKSDSGKSYPRLIFQAVQFNLKLGFSEPLLRGDSIFFLTIPVDNHLVAIK
ncbi:MULTISPECIES: MBL fold metallo-hydrolase [Candidatus Ichthyocystis]|uniref:Putative membrane protein, metallo-beta-lactamase superfamily n=1 Tax=Candidatus Ichthyocystis hellenicum TaxID=1561003 RepID=A0A0S4M6Y3_9BURK|nr:MULTISPECIES: MBL fold metallo-hydrolase [Ichthyocystis]CUT17912.1 putative membrane protein, metallo-beta-lactamase superfamily [Candidatus Ichthyocystis hellenicum]